MLPDVFQSDGSSRRSTRSSLSAPSVRSLDDIAVVDDVTNDTFGLPKDERAPRLAAIKATTTTVQAEDETAQRRLAAFAALAPAPKTTFVAEMTALRALSANVMPLRVAGRSTDERLSLGDLLYIANNIETLARALERQLPLLFESVRAATADSRGRRQPLSTVDLMMRVVIRLFAVSVLSAVAVAVVAGAESRVQHSLRTPAATARLLQGSGCAVASRDIAISAVLEAPSLMDARLNAALKAGSFFFSVCPRFY